MHVSFVFTLLLCVLYVVTQETAPTGPFNMYCDPSLCTRGKRHVACEKFPSVRAGCRSPLQDRILIKKFTSAGLSETLQQRDSIYRESDRLCGYHTQDAQRTTSALGPGSQHDTATCRPPGGDAVERGARHVGQLQCALVPAQVRRLPQHGQLQAFRPEHYREYKLQGVWQGQPDHALLSLPQLFNMTRLVEQDLLEKMYPQLLTIAGRTWWSEATDNSSNLMTTTDVQHYPCSLKKPTQKQ